MASTFSPNLRLELIGTGEQQGTWGATTNTNLGTLLEEAIGGYVDVTVSNSGDTTLTTNNGSADQSRNMVLNLTGTISAARNVICPAIEKVYLVKNSTTGGFAVTLKVSGQTGVSIPNGVIYLLYVDGTDVRLGGIATVPDGDKGDITVSNTGATWTIDNGVVSTSKLGGDITTAGKALLDDADAATQRTTLGLGNVATLNVGTAANNVVQLDSSAKLPAVDGSQLTNVPIPIPAYTISNTQTFNANGTWTKPANGTYAIVRCWAGGASGAKYTTPPSSTILYSTGGGGGAFHERVFLLTDLTANVTVTVGAGGLAQKTSSSNGNPGGTTSFGSYLSTFGGAGGLFGTKGTAGGGGGGSGSAASGTTSGNAATSVSLLSVQAVGGVAPDGSASNIAAFVSAIANYRNGPGEDNNYGGGAGNSASNTTVATSVWGGGGGGGISGSNTSSTLYAAGTSTYGGNGGAASNAGNGTSGAAPGGGGGATFGGTQSGAGGDGRVIVYVI